MGKQAPRRIELRAVDLERLGIDLVFLNSADDERNAKALEQARLIAAAPDLLAALESIVRSADLNQAAINTFLLIIAREAIAKASA